VDLTWSVTYLGFFGSVVESFPLFMIVLHFLHPGLVVFSWSGVFANRPDFPVHIFFYSYFSPFGAVLEWAGHGHLGA
jgi:hypothetical protein